MNTTKITSIILCQILLLSIVAFAQEATTDKEDNDFDPQKYIEDIKDTKVGDLQTKIDQLDTDKKIKSVLDHITTNINKEEFKELRESAEYLTGKIISQKSNNKKLDFKIDKESAVQGITINDKDLNIKVNNKDFKIPLEKIPESVTGIEVTERGVLYTTKTNGQIEMTEPKNTLNLVEKEGKLFIENYKGIDGEVHELEISFSQKGRVSFLENGEIEFSGGAVIYDPATKTKFELKDKTGSPGYINFYKKGHIIKPFQATNILVTKKSNQEIIFDIKKTNKDGVFILSEDEINKENYNDFPPNLDKENSFLIDPEGKKIYIAEDENVIGTIKGDKTQYRMIGIPGTPDGGVLVDGTFGFREGKIGATPGTPGTGYPETGSPGGILGGALKGILPFAIIGGLLAIALAIGLGGGDKSKKESKYENQTKYKNGDPYQGEDITYNGKGLSTGKPSTTKKPTIQSTYD